MRVSSFNLASGSHLRVISIDHNFVFVLLAWQGSFLFFFVVCSSRFNSSYCSSLFLHTNFPCTVFHSFVTLSFDFCFCHSLLCFIVHSTVKCLFQKIVTESCTVTVTGHYPVTLHPAQYCAVLYCTGTVRS